MAEPFPRASPGVPPMAMALRLGAGPAKAAPTRRSARGIFPAAHVAGKNDSDSFRLAPETRKGAPLPGPFPGGRGTKVPGRLPASIGSTCCPPGREAASAEGPLRRQDGGPRSAACFCWKYLLSAWPRSGFGGGRAAAAAGRGSPVGCLLLLEVPAVRLAAKRLRRRRGRCGGGTGVPGRLPASIGSTCCPPGRLVASAAGGCRCHKSLRLPCVKGAGARRATEGLFAETSPNALSPGQHPCLTAEPISGRYRGGG